ncbi:hypothetical protein bpr_II199 (plasmid) [Butyrivibrio proteoclasticus B316]|uniref:Uncharacterized protein n=1 Tax=Butyrivibrio proteoclasticus (strain ATCC 51982 / DSM 14932 / B316) TaxID=515622 RepID=E0S405_BUTPB|nr:hypothetical protein [Butyrivibrio proteoclasticus]ADL36137.1 hypothetical protein bpr_II199 [Butyrivibrio proteoclasticus B316]
MNRWIWGEESDYPHSKCLINIDQIAVMDPMAHTIFVGAIHGEKAGVLHLTKESFDKLFDVVTKNDVIYETNNDLIRKD